MTGRTFVSQQHMIAFTVDGRRADATACRGMWQATDVKNIHVLSDPGAGHCLPTVSGAELDPFSAMLLLRRYLTASQVHLPNPAGTDEKLWCLERLSTKADMAPFKVGHDHFATIAGDAVHVIQCKQLKVKLRATQKCYRDIPVVHDRWQFLDIEKRVAKQLSSERLCQMHFPVKVEGLYHWWTLDGGIKHADPPKRWTGRPTASPAIPKTDCFYTQAEIDEWEAVQTMPVYIQQLEGSICLKSCAALLGCPQPAQTGGYDWAKLKQAVPLSSMMATIQTTWEWLGYVDQGLVFFFVPVMIVLLVKIWRLENALASRQGSVNVAVAAPSVIPLQTMTAAADQPQARSNLNNPYRLAFD